MVATANILAKVLIQVGADEPKAIGTIEIPVIFTMPGVTNTATLPCAPCLLDDKDCPHK